ncbi:TRIO and F-actin-binding protein isoform 2-T2 [Liasis olivaceus]
MSEPADYPLCEKFEANVFAKNRCQNCLRTITAHQHYNQVFKEDAINTPNCIASTSESGPGDPWDPLCILAPQCKLYVCVGSEDRTESWQESLEYTQLNCRNEEESEAANICPDASSTPSTDPDGSAMLSEDQEMTRLLSNILESEKENTLPSASQKKKVQSENLHSDRHRWAEATSCRRTVSWSCLKPESRIMSQDYGNSRRKHQAESGYFSLECHKSESSWTSSASCTNHSMLPASSNATGASRWPTSSLSLADSELSWCKSASSEGRHGLMRQNYTVLADLPKAKRLHHQEAFEKERSRAHSPGRAEVERIFGQERRKSETLEVFQALEEGLLERLDSKSLKLAKEGRLVRRQSSPTLCREVKKRFQWEPEQSRKRESLCIGRSEQQLKISSQSQGESSHVRSPTQQLQRETQSRGMPLYSATSTSQKMEREGRKLEELVSHLSSSAERAVLRPMTHGKQMDNSRKNQLEILHHKSPGKNGLETRWKSCVSALHAANPSKTLDKNQARLTRQLDRYKESDRKARGKPLLLVGTVDQPKKDIRDSQEVICAVGPRSGIVARGKGGQPLVCSRLGHDQWGAQGEKKHSFNPRKEIGINLKNHSAETVNSFSPGRSTGRSQREIRHSCSPGRCSENSWNSLRELRHSQSPGRLMESSQMCLEQTRCCAASQQHLENNWKSQREARSLRASTSSDWLSKRDLSVAFTSRKENDLKGCCTSFGPTDPAVFGQKSMAQEAHSVKPGTSPRIQEGYQSHVHPMPSLEKEWVSQGECFHSAKPGQKQLENNRENQGSPVKWAEDKWIDWQRCPSPSTAEKQLGNEEKLSYLKQQGGRHAATSACSSRSQILYLDTSKKHKPDLLNFKKGWMSILDEPGEWTKHWFVLTDSSLRYYRDSNAEEADDLDGEIDLRTCTDVTEYAVQRNYGFQIHTKDGVFTLSAMTSGIRRNWIEALRKSIRPVSVPDVTKLSDYNKENSFRSNKSPKSSFRTELQPNAGSEVISRPGRRKAEARYQAFDYVELSPLQQGSALNQGSPQQPRGSTRTADGAAKREELERDLALRSEERRKWFESSVSGGLQTDGPTEDPCPKKPPGIPLTEAQRSRLSEEIEKKWQELERLPLKESKRVPLMALLNQGKGNHEDASEALEKEVQVLRSQLESLHSHSEANLHKNGHVPQGYLSQEACEHSLAEMETSHQQVMAELQRHHQWEMERLRQEKERLLSEEAAATAAAIEALKKAHREEMNKELGRTRNFQKGFSNPDALQQQHRSDVESLKRELQVLSEQYSQKCLEIGGLVQKAEDQEQMLQHCQQEGKELLRQNQELQRRLSEEIGQLRAFIATRGSHDGASHNERSSCELEVLLRVKENELQYQKQEVQCLRDELQMMQKDKKFASGKYQDIYVELNHIKQRSEEEIEQLKEHLRLAMAALEEKEMLHNSTG